jgi:SulP family sulfate permease
MDPKETVKSKVAIRVISARPKAPAEASSGTALLVALRNGSSAFVISLPSVIAAGVIAFGPLGPVAMATGVTAALLGAAIGLLLCTALSRTRGIVIAPTSAVALITAGVFTAMIERGELLAGDALTGLAVLMLLGLLSAVFQLAMAAAQLGRLVPLLPYPVIAGLINGTAALLLVSQLPMALGLAQGNGPLAGAAVVTVATLGLALVKWPWSVPAPVGAVLAGAALHYALAAWVPGLPLGGLIGGMEPLALHGELLAGAYARIPGITLETVFEVLIPAALSTALLSSIQMMASVAAIRDAGGAHGASQRDMLAIWPQLPRVA